MVNLSGEECRPYFIKNLGITETNKSCNPGVLIVRLGYAIGGVIALLVAMAGAKRARALDETAKAQEKGNVEERYKNAIEQLAKKEDPSVSLAGAYGLYYLARDNEDRRENICDVLCVHIRGLTTSKALIFNGESYSNAYKDKPSDEVQSILDLLTNKDNKEDFPFKSDWINLENTYLNGANFKKAQLQEANLKAAHLRGANLDGAQLKRANLKQVQLQGADLERSQLQWADLSSAQFQGAQLSFAQLQCANLQKAQFQGAKLMAAQLQGATLYQAQLQGTDLRYAQLQGAALWEVQLQGANLKEARLQGAHLDKAQLQGADLSEAHLQEADLKEAHLQGAYLHMAQFQGADLNKTNFSGAFTEKDIGIGSAIERLEARRNQKDEIENVIFGGGVTVKQLKNFREKRADIEKVLVDTKYNKINYFKETMTKVEKILEDNLDKPIDTSIPSGVITGVYPQAEADKIIAMLEKIKNELAET